MSDSKSSAERGLTFNPSDMGPLAQLIVNTGRLDTVIQHHSTNQIWNERDRFEAIALIIDEVIDLITNANVIVPSKPDEDREAVMDEIYRERYLQPYNQWLMSSEDGTPTVEQRDIPKFVAVLLRTLESRLGNVVKVATDQRLPLLAKGFLDRGEITLIEPTESQPEIIIKFLKRKSDTTSVSFNIRVKSPAPVPGSDKGGFEQRQFDEKVGEALKFYRSMLLPSVVHASNKSSLRQAYSTPTGQNAYSAESKNAATQAWAELVDQGKYMQVEELPEALSEWSGGNYAYYLEEEGRFYLRVNEFESDGDMHFQPLLTQEQKAPVLEEIEDEKQGRLDLIKEEIENIVSSSISTATKEDPATVKSLLTLVTEELLLGSLSPEEKELIKRTIEALLLQDIANALNPNNDTHRAAQLKVRDSKNGISRRMVVNLDSIVGVGDRVADIAEIKVWNTDFE